MKKKSLSAKKTKHNSLLSYLKNKKINEVFNHFENCLKNYDYKLNKMGIAISGGPDSLALAYLAKCYSLIYRVKISFFIVDHLLRPESSKEAKTVKYLLKKFKINCNILKWKGIKPHSNIQGIARDNRYRLLVKACNSKNINFLLTGHHADDLYENFLMRLSRGSGLKGLSSFGESTKEEKDKVLILRPLIKIEKKKLIYICNKVFQFFIEDPSNKNTLFQRTRIRKIIAALDKEGLDKKKLYSTIKNLKSANEAIDFYVYKNIRDNAKYINDKNTYILNNFFLSQPNEVTFRSISAVLKKISGKYYSPRGKSISNFILKIKANNYKKFTLGGCYLEKINQTVLITKEKGH